MATFTVGSFSSTNSAKKRGQSFAANVAGPDGTGAGPGSANPVYVQSVSVGYPSSSTTGRTGAAYLYSSLPTLSDLNAGNGCLACSQSTSDENLFGANTYSRTFYFSKVSIDPTATYFVLFPCDQSVRYASGTNPYSGGTSYSPILASETTNDLQFQVSLTDV